MNRKTGTTDIDKFKSAVRDLEHALQFEKKIEGDPFYFAGIAKSFETTLEYACKYLKRRATAEGFEAFSPKEAIKLGGKLHIIENVEDWLGYLEDRNLAVHDYLGLSIKEYLKTIHKFLRDAKKLAAEKG